MQWRPKPGDAVAAGTIAQLSAEAAIVGQQPGFHLLMRGMTRDGDDDGEDAREQLRQMHEKKTARL